MPTALEMGPLLVGFAAITAALYFLGAVFQLCIVARKTRPLLRRRGLQHVLRQLRSWCCPSGPVSDAMRDLRMANIRGWIDGIALVLLLSGCCDAQQALSEHDDHSQGTLVIRLLVPAAAYAVACGCVSRPSFLTPATLHIVMLLFLCVTCVQASLWKGDASSAFVITFVVGAVVTLDCKACVTACALVFLARKLQLGPDAEDGSAVFDDEDLWSELFSWVFQPCVMSLFYSCVLHAYCTVSLGLESSQDAGRALCTLLDAQFDAIIELDENADIRHASKRFYGMISVKPPEGDLETNQLIQIVPAKAESEDDHADSQGEPPATTSVVGQSFSSMLSDNEDEAALLAKLREQDASWWSSHCEQPAEEKSTASQLATVLNVRMRFKQDAAVRACCLYFATWFDFISLRLRFFVALRAPDEEPQEPASLAMPAPTVQETVSFIATFNAGDPTWPLLKEAVLDAVQLAAGVRLSGLFSPKLFKGMLKFVNRQLADYRSGLLEQRRWVYGRIGTVADGHTQEDQAVFELDKDGDDLVEMIIKIITTPCSFPRPRSRGSHSRSNSSRNSERSSSSQSATSLCSISEVDGAEEAPAADGAPRQHAGAATADANLVTPPGAPTHAHADTEMPCTAAPRGAITDAAHIETLFYDRAAESKLEL